MNAPGLTVVIVNYNALSHVRRCLDSLALGAAGLAWEAIVVDNASREGGVEALREAYPNLRVVRRMVNGGFAVGANVGLRAMRADAALLLNPDTVVRPGAATALLAYARTHDDAGIIGPRIENPDGTLQLSCRAFPTLWTGLFNRYSLLTRLAPSNRHSSAYLMTDVDHTVTRDVDWLSGAAMLIPRRTIERVGLFDEGYFFAIEDVDYCRRVHDAGLRVIYHPQAVVVHQIGASSSTIPSRIEVARHRGMWRYYRRHLRGNRGMDVAVAIGIMVRCLVRLALVNGARAARAARPTRVPAGFGR